jgi:hypothetical protein
MRTAPPCKGADAHHPLDSRQAMFAPRLHSRPRWTVRTAAPGSTLSTATGHARASFTLTLATLGLIRVIASVDVPWGSLIAPLLALLTLALFFAAQHSHERRFSWLLSASVAAGLTIADVYDLSKTAPTAYVAVLVIGIALLVVHLTRRPQPGCSRTTREALPRPLMAYWSSRPSKTARAEAALHDAPSVSRSPADPDNTSLRPSARIGVASLLRRVGRGRVGCPGRRRPARPRR